MDKKLKDFLRQAADIHMSEDEALRVRGMIEQKMTKNAVRAADPSCLTSDMDDLNPSFVAKARQIRLSDKEAAESQKRLHAFMDAHPVNMAKAVRNQERTQSGWASVRTLFSLRYGPVLAAVLILIGAGSGISYAAESALPGDPLYPIKVHVNETVKASLAFTPQAKAAVNAQIATERLHEAEQLAATGKLTTDASAALIAAFQMHLDDAHRAIADVAASGKKQDAMTIDDDVENTLQNHSAILHTLAQADSGSNVHSEIAVILQNVDDAAQKTIAFQKTLDGNGQIALNVALPFAATDANGDDTGDAHNARMMQVQINQQTEEHHETSSSDDHGNSENTEVHTFANTHVNVSNTMGIMMKTGSGAASSGSGSSSTQSSNGVSVHIENNDSTQVNTQNDSMTDSNVQINTSTTTNVTNEVHIEQSNH